MATKLVRSALYLALPALVAGCVSNPMKREEAAEASPPPASTSPAAQTTAPPATAATATPDKVQKGSKPSKDKPVTAAASPAPEPAASGKVGPGMNARGEVVDSTKVESGFGTKVKGIRDWEGEITGKPPAGTKFTQLQIGMSIKQVTDLIGQPSDQGAYVTGKAFIPFFFGSDTHRQEYVYKGQGRLIFAGGSMFSDVASGNLIWIIHNGNEPAYR